MLGSFSKASTCDPGKVRWRVGVEEGLVWEKTCHFSPAVGKGRERKDRSLSPCSSTQWMPEPIAYCRESSKPETYLKPPQINLLELTFWSGLPSFTGGQS